MEMPSYLLLLLLCGKSERAEQKHRIKYPTVVSGCPLLPFVNQLQWFASFWLVHWVGCIL